MSVLLEDLAIQQQQSSRSPTGNDRTFRRLATKKILRLDSPTTIQACEELGILVEDLKQKTIEDFKDNAVEEDIVELRFNHYLKRFKQTLSDVTARKKQINRRLRNQQQQLDQQNLLNEQRKMGAMTPVPATMQAFSNTGFPSAFASPLGLSKSNSVVGPLVSSPVATDFNKTVFYFRKSHGSAEIKNLDEIVGNRECMTPSEHSPVGRFHKTMSEEVFKFNKIKRQKQLEAKELYDADLKRIKLLEEERIRQEKMKEKEKKMLLEKKKQKEERMRLREEKAEKIKEIEKQYKDHKEEEKAKIRQKLEAARRKFEEETDQKKKIIAERERLLQQKMKEANEKREKMKQDELRASDQLKEFIDEKIYITEERHNMNLDQKSRSVKARLEQVEECVAKNKEKREQDKVVYVQKLTMKLVKEEENVRASKIAFKEKYIKDIKKRQASLAERDRRLEDHQKDIDGKHNEKMEEINERFRKVQENLETKRQIDEKNRKLKGELNRLKLLDKFENHNRLQRRLQFERLKVLDKEKHDQEKIYWLKSHREFAQQMKLEVAIQSKIDRDMIEEGVNHLSKLVYGSNSTRAVTDSQKRILKFVLQPEDYKAIEEAEKKKEAERKAKLNEEGNNQVFTQTKKKY